MKLDERLVATDELRAHAFPGAPAQVDTQDYVLAGHSGLRLTDPSVVPATGCQRLIHPHKQYTAPFEAAL